MALDLQLPDHGDLVLGGERHRAVELRHRGLDLGRQQSGVDRLGDGHVSVLGR